MEVVCNAYINERRRTEMRSARSGFEGGAQGNEKYEMGHDKGNDGVSQDVMSME